MRDNLPYHPFVICKTEPSYCFSCKTDFFLLSTIFTKEERYCAAVILFGRWVPVFICRQERSPPGANFSYTSTGFPNSLPALSNFSLVQRVLPKHWFSSTRLHCIRNKREVSFTLPLLFERDKCSYTLWHKRQKTGTCLLIIIIIIISFLDFKLLPCSLCSMFLLGNSPASEFQKQTFRNPLSVPSSRAGG